MLRALHSVDLIALSLVFGAAAAWVDLHNDEVQAPVALLLAGAWALAFVAPRHAWIPALVVGLCIPLGHLLARAAGSGVPYQISGGLATTFLALIPSSIGALAGVGVRAVLTGPR